MPTYNKKTWTTEELATSTGLNQMSDNIELALRNKNSDIELATGTWEGTFNGSINAVSTTITFATDADDGDPGFTAAPLLWAQFILSSGTEPIDVCDIQFTSITATTAVVSIRAQNIPLSGRTRKIRWFALGAV